MYRELPHTSFYNRVNFDRTKGISNINCACRMVLSMSTKKLAKELGLLRKRRQATENKAFIVCNQIFSYLIVIDFESTCWREKNNYGQEIIEFPAVLLNTSTGEIDSEFHTYVQPQEHPVLSEFCTELTGITQRQVEEGIPLHICLSRFSRWLQTLQLQKGLTLPGERSSSTSSAFQKPCAFVTWSDWDLAVCLQYECKRKQLHKPDVLNSWIDLRATYRLFYSRKPKGLNGALQDLGIQFSGREHSGLDDSRNTAQLALRMMRDGCVMKLTRTQERAPMKPKPLFGNAPVENKESKENMAPDEKTLSSEETSAKRSLQIKTCSKTNVPLSDTKRNGNSIQEPFQEYKSLVSPRTLLNGTTTPLLGKGTVAGKKTTMDLFSPVLVNAPSRRDNSHSLVLCSTTVGSISHLPQVCPTFEPQTAMLEHTKDGTETDISVDTEEWHGCYDYEVLDGDDGVNADLYESLDANDNSGESSLSKYVNSSILIPHQINVIAKNKTVFVNKNGNGPKLEASSLSNNIKPSSLVCVNEIRQLPHASLANRSALRSNSITSNQPKVVSSNVRLHVQDNSKAPQNKSRTGNSSSLITHKVNVQERTLESYLLTKPTPVIIQHHATRPCSKKPNGKEAGSFIYSDTAENPRPTSAHSLRTPQSAIPSISSNPMSSRSCPLTTTRSSLQHPSRPWPPRITAPLCGCGRRAKRQTVCNGGPNQGLGFYCCPVRRSGSGNMIQNGCKFFKWESALIKDHSPANSCVQSSISLHVLRRPQLSSTSRKSY
ncbi:ERI1 exoribonuclease 2 isoform X1 [Gadus morhua]|uniref:ERI1 exoribonuclease 2 isoform X1 n=1 Tax=Gadus morhua TaxID=8049 RepID=UPI0011B734AE|nr:ERI1 exoribonuclease 2 isoform X1 [Gadus morhua]